MKLLGNVILLVSEEEYFGLKQPKSALAYLRETKGLYWKDSWQFINQNESKTTSSCKGQNMGKLAGEGNKSLTVQLVCFISSLFLSYVNGGDSKS